jgi:hypothetical protein
LAPYKIIFLLQNMACLLCEVVDGLRKELTKHGRKISLVLSVYLEKRIDISFDMADDAHSVGMCALG